MAAHRYWRLYINATVSAYPVLISEIEMAATAGGADVTTGGTALQSSSWDAGSTGAKVFDNAGFGTNQWWQAANGTTTGQWVGYDFGAGNEKDIKEIRIYYQNGFRSRAPTNIDVQYSDDGSAWTTARSFPVVPHWNYTSNTSGTSPWVILSLDTLSVGESREWRINVTAINGGNFGVLISEVELRGSVGGADLTDSVSGLAYADNANTGELPEEAFDNIDANYWQSASVPTPSAPHFIGYQFNSLQTAAEVAIKPLSGFTNRAPKDFTLEYWNGQVWIVAATFTSQTSWTDATFSAFATGSGGGGPGGGGTSATCMLTIIT